MATELLTLEHRITKLLRARGPLDLVDLVSRTGAPHDIVKRALQDLEQRGQVHRVLEQGSSQPIFRLVKH